MRPARSRAWVAEVSASARMFWIVAGDLLDAGGAVGGAGHQLGTGVFQHMRGAAIGFGGFGGVFDGAAHFAQHAVEVVGHAADFRPGWGF